MLWAAITVLIRGSALARTSATKTLFYQVGVSAFMLPASSVLLAEPGVSRITPFGVAAGMLVHDERVSASFALAALLVGAGIVMVNLRRP